MNNYKISGVLLLLCILFSCDDYNLVRTNPYDPESENFKPSVPVLTTSSATAITSSSAKSGGNVTSDGGAIVTARGVCWKIATSPTITNSKTADGTGKGSFASSLTGLTAGTKYYVRAYATNTAGTGYGNEINFTTTTVTVTDNDGNVYNTVTIGTQVWMKENLKTTKFNDGTSIPLVTDATAWSNLSTPGYCWYNNDAASYKAAFGALYNFYAVYTGKLCPTGWHVPTDAEWTIMTDYLGGLSVAGGKLKEMGTTHWTTPNTGATNESGFTALPGGGRSFNGPFSSINNNGYWWSSTTDLTDNAWERASFYDNVTVTRNYTTKRGGYSIRCIKD